MTLKLLLIATLLAERHRANTSFQGSALECTVFEALPREWGSFPIGGIAKPQAEPARQWVTRQSLVTSWWRSARSVLIALVLIFVEIRFATNANSLLADEPPIGPARLIWTALPDLPNELGVAGPFVGVHSDALIVAGGANFQRPVWESQKNWLDQIWVLTLTKSGMKWQSGGNLPRPLAYGAAVSTLHGVVCIGGNDQDQTYRDVFLLKWDSVQQQLTSREYPPLPSAFAYGQATTVGAVVYVAGGGVVSSGRRIARD